MSAIRGVLLILVAVFLFLSFLSLNLLWTLSASLNYDTLQRESTIIVNDFLQETNITNIIHQNYHLIQFYCQNYSNYVFNYQGHTFDIPCSIALQGENAIIEEGVKDAIHDVYYEEYNCNFFDCFKKSPIPLFLISKKAYDFWVEKFYFCLITSFILFILVFLLVEKKTNAFILSGSLLIISAIPFIKLDYLYSLFSNKMIFKFLEIFFSQAFQVSIKTLLIGAGLLIFGIVIDIFKVGFFISDFISKIREEKEKKSKLKKKTKTSK
jgi:hypothetical protein